MTIYDYLSDLDIDTLSEQCGGRYRLTRLVSERMRQVQGGAPLLVEREEEEEPLLAMVLREIREGKVWFELPEETAEEAEESALDLLGLDDDVDDL